MMNVMNQKIKKFSFTPSAVYVVYSAIFAIIVAFALLGGDDVAVFEISGNGIMGWAKWAYGHYQTWSSRQIINFIWAAVLHLGKFAWMLYMGISMFLFLKALTLLCDLQAKPGSVAFLLAVTSLFPFAILTTAGWIATSTTYFGPIACGLMSLVPAVNAYKGKKEKERFPSFAFYAWCLVYGANQEQMMIVIFAAYTLVVGCLAFKKALNWQITALFLLAVASLVYTATCPGNFNRGEQEYAWFPFYDMLDVVDKAELGASTTLEWLFVDSQAVVVFALAVLSFCVWKRYQEPIYRVISAFPVAFALFFGVLKNVSFAWFPYAGMLHSSFDYFGAFSPADPEAKISVLRFALLLFVCLSVVITVYLLSHSLKDFYIDLFLIVFGTASRVMMGFSPTVYASSERTFSVLVFCLIAVLVRVFYRNEKYVLNTPKSKAAMKYVSGTCVVLGLLNLTVLVFTRFS